MGNKDWHLAETLVQVRNEWIALIGERLINDQGKELNYWRVERSDSVLILPIHQGMFLLPQPVYRPGIGQRTYDFPGGRHDPTISLEQAARQILSRELQIYPEHVDELRPVNEEGWNVDSSFSSQKIFVFQAWIMDNVSLNSETVHIAYPANMSGAQQLLARLSCLQCRCALLEWMLINQMV